MGAQFMVVVYDISDDRRRTRLHDLLVDYGSAVQYSVFECLLDKDEIERMKKAIRKVIRPRKDAVRYYYLCQECARRTEVTCGKEVLAAGEAAMIAG